MSCPGGCMPVHCWSYITWKSWTPEMVHRFLALPPASCATNKVGYIFPEVWTLLILLSSLLLIETSISNEVVTTDVYIIPIQVSAPSKPVPILCSKKNFIHSFDYPVKLHHLYSICFLLQRWGGYMQPFWCKFLKLFFYFWENLYTSAYAAVNRNALIHL